MVNLRSRAKCQIWRVVQWTRAHPVRQVNRVIRELSWPDESQAGPEPGDEIPPPPDDLEKRIREQLEVDPVQPWEQALWTMIVGKGDEYPEVPRDRGAAHASTHSSARRA
jgi:hypothetical protein